MNQQHRLQPSSLVQLLLQWGQGDQAQVRPDVAQRLGQWLGAWDADRLNTALHAIGSQPGPARAQRVDAAALEDLVRAVQSELTAWIEAAGAGDAHGGDPGLATGPAQRMAGLQKTLAQRLAALRAQVRQTLARGPVRLRRLAALDAVLEQMLGPREQRLWAALPGHLAQHQAQGPGSDADLRTLLLAEMQVRLQPVVGLVEAARTDHREHA